MAPSSVARLVNALVLCLLVPQTGAMFEDQAGLVDWFRANIGRVQLVGFPRITRGNKFSYLATAENIVAAVNLRTGDTAWRQVLPSGESVDQLHVTHKSVLTVSTAARQLRMWNAADGSLIWDEPVAVAGEEGSLKSLVLQNGGVVTLIDGERLEMRSDSTGRLEWSWSAPKETRLEMLSLSTEGDVIHVVGSRNSKPVLASLNNKGKQTTELVELKSADLTEPPKMHLFGGLLAYYEDASCTVAIHDLSTAALHSTLKLDNEDDCKSAAILDTQMPEHFLLQTVRNTILVEATVDSSRIVHTFTGSHSFSSSHANDGHHLLSASSMTKDEASISVYTLKPFEIFSSSACNKLSLSQNGAVADSFLSSYTKSSGMIGARVMLVTADHSLSLVQNGEVIWTRDEALARIRQVEFAVPPSATQRMDDDQRSTPVAPDNMVQGFLTKLHTMFQPRTQGREQSTGAGDDTSAVFADRFGFRRIAVLMTDAGKLLGLNTETSEIVWSRFYALEGDQSHNPQTAPVLKQMVVVRNSREHAPECIVIGHDPFAPSHFPTFLSSFNPLTGSEAHFQALRYTVRHAILLPDQISEQRRLLLIIDGDYKAHVFPDTEEAQALVKQRLPQIFFHEVDKVSQLVRGFRLVVDDADKDSYSCEQTWQIVLPEGERIDSVEQRSTEDQIFSPFYVTGKHNVLFKYLNPNLLLVSTISEATPFFKSRLSQQESGSSVHLYAIDAVTGRVVYHVAHPNSAGPTHLVLSENWVAHSYWSTRHLRTELSVLELWEDTGVQESMGELLVKNVKNKLFGAAKVSTRTGGHFATSTQLPKHDIFSAMEHASPQKEEQSFVLPTGVRAASVTSTQKGITSKHLLFGTDSDKLLSIPWQHINPRRPMEKPTEDEMSEGLIQYDAQIPMITTSILSYNHTIANLRAIRAAPADLESTSLVLAYGVDLFFIRITPSKPFDVLNDDFNYIGLALTIVVLAVASAVMMVVVKKKDLDYAWR